MARITGVVYLLFFVTAIVGVLIAPGTGGPGALPTDAAATASRIVTHESAYELGIALGLVSTALYLVLAALFYLLLRPVSRPLSLLMLVFDLVLCAVTAFATVFQLAPLVVLGGSAYLSVFDVHQLQALALLSLYLSAQTEHVALVFAGGFQLFFGYLIYRSTFLPRVIGVLIAAAGVGWLTFLFPPVANALLTYTVVLGIAAETSLMLWLIVMGVNTERWTEVAARARAPLAA
jgi:hypothetical protein